MNDAIENLYQQIGQIVYANQPEVPWKKGEYWFTGITRYMEERGCYELPDSSKKYFVTGGKLTEPFVRLRTEMAKLHENGHAWYTATFTLTPDGDFKFDFDYDHLPAWDIIPSPDKWLDEFKHYPRPEIQAHIQDWIDGKIGYDRAEIIVERLKELAARWNARS